MLNPARFSPLADSGVKSPNIAAATIRGQLAPRVHIKRQKQSPLWRQYATLFGSVCSVCACSCGVRPAAFSRLLRSRLRGIWSVRPAGHHAHDLVPNRLSDPVGASNATTGLVAGATNATLSEIGESTSSDYTAAVWYQGGAPLTTPEVNLLPERAGREMHGMRHPMPEEPGPRERGPRKEAREGWLYFTGSEYTANVVAAASGGKGSESQPRLYQRRRNPPEREKWSCEVRRQERKNSVIRLEAIGPSKSHLFVRPIA